MNAIGSKQQQVLESTRQLLNESELQRKSLRFDRSVQEFSEGKIELLKHPEFADNLGTHLLKTHREGRQQHVASLISILGKSVCDKDNVIRENGVNVLVEFSGNFVGSNNFRIIYDLFNPLVSWFSYEENLIKRYGVACSQLHKFAQKLLENKIHWNKSENLLEFLQQIQDGRLPKNNAIREMALTLQESLATSRVLKNLVNCYLNDKSDLKGTAEIILTNLGRRSSVHMMNVLMHSDSKEERLQLIKLIPEAGKAVVPVLAECLQKKPPWYVVRNIVIIISELNDPSFYPIVQSYLAHKDIRVQQQVICCIVRLGGPEYKDRLIDALFRVYDELKLPVIMQLARSGGDDAVNALVRLLEFRQSFARETYIELLVRLCSAMTFCFTADVIAPLKDLILERQVQAGPSDLILSAARDTLIALKPHFAEEVNRAIEETSLSEAEFGSPGMSHQARFARRTDLSIKELVEQGELDSAGKKLFANAVNAARDNDFSSAELLRDKILEISPLALSEVIRLGEIIEEEKSSSISSHHIAIWSELYERMTTEEFNALYYTLKQERYYSDDIIVRAGETEPSLYFINSGVIILSCQSDDRDTVLKRLQPGEVVGVAPFFDSSVWTVSMTARTEAQVHVLVEAKFKELERKYPGIGKKLHEYCITYDTVPQLLQMAGSDRRRDTRYLKHVIINNMLLDPYGNVGKRGFKGELIDISRGGLCFSVNISSRENARLLLGRQIVSEIEFGNGDKLKCFGIIVGGRYQEEGGQDFSVHVNFYQHLDRESVNQILDLER